MVGDANAGEDGWGDGLEPENGIWGNEVMLATPPQCSYIHQMFNMLDNTPSNTVKTILI